MCLRTIFLEILNGTNYRNHPYLDGKTKVSYGYSLKPIHWHFPFQTVKNQCLKPPGRGCRQLSYNGGDTFGEQRNRSLMQQKLSVLAVGVSDHKKSALVDTTSEMQSEPFPTIVRKILFPPETVHTVCIYLYIYIYVCIYIYMYFCLLTTHKSWREICEDICRGRRRKSTRNPNSNYTGFLPRVDAKVKT